MAEYSPKVEYDPGKNRITMDGEHVVLHCQHYNLGFVRMVLDAQEYIDGGRIMTQAAAEMTHKLLDKQPGGDPGEVLDTARGMFAQLGFGSIDFGGVAEDGGEVQVTHSHIGNGWQAKYDKPSKQPVDYLARGFIAGALAKAYGKDKGAYEVTQEKSLAKGDELSTFQVEVG
jgi:predicted hydrocarbon binding protein